MKGGIWVSDASRFRLWRRLALGSVFRSAGGCGGLPDDAVFVCVDGDLHPVPQAELGEDADDVSLDGGSLR